MAEQEGSLDIPPSPVQRRGTGEVGTSVIHRAAAAGIAGEQTALPHAAAIQESFGHDFDVSSIAAHVGGPARDACNDMGAAAYATGNHAVFATSPDLHTAAHEAAHVVQQRHGVSLYGGVGIPGDPYEQHADAVADRVVAGQSAASLLRSGPAGAPGIQRKESAAGATAATKDGAPATSAADKAQMQAVEKTMTTVKAQASQRVTEVGTLNDAAIQALQDATTQLKQSSKNYKTAYTRFTDKLKEADARFEAEQAIVDSVQGILVAAALSVIGPEALVVGGAVKGLEAAAAKHAGQLVSYGFKAAAKAVEGGAGEIAEQAAGGVVNSAGDPVKPSSTAAGAGDTASDKYEQAFGKLSDIVAAMPKLGKTMSSTSDIAVAAGDLALEAVRLAGGGTGKWTIAEVQQKSTGINELNTASAGVLATVRFMTNDVVAMANQVKFVPVKPVDDIERLLWTNWMASLQGEKNEVLDNDVIQDYLTSKGMIKPGSYMSDSDQYDAVENARKDFLRGRGITLSDSACIDSLYRREMKLDDLRRSLIGKHGTVSEKDRVTVGGQNFSCPGMCGGAVDDEVVIQMVIVKPFMQDQSINLAEWRDDEYEVLGSTVEYLQRAGHG